MKICIIGIGMMGGSLGFALKEAGADEIIGWDSDAAAVEKAMSLGAIDRPAERFAGGPDARDCDFVFIATPLEQTPRVLADISQSLGPETIVTDIDSIKCPVVEAADKVLGEKAINFVGGHPMCGSERSGIENADRELFKGASYFLTPTSGTGTIAYSNLHRLITGLGADVIAVEPARHDEIVAAISHLPHLISFALFELVRDSGRGDVDLNRFAGGSLKDMTRVAASDPAMWSRIMKGNLAAVGEAAADFSRKLEGLLRLAAEDRTALEERLSGIRQDRLRLEAAREFDLAGAMNLYVAVKDRPGVISEITVALGFLGINIEDIGLEHGVREGGGLLRLTVADEATAFKAKSSLRAQGFDVTVSSYLEDADR